MVADASFNNRYQVREVNRSIHHREFEEQVFNSVHYIGRSRRSQLIVQVSSEVRNLYRLQFSFHETDSWYVLQELGVYKGRLPSVGSE